MLSLFSKGAANHSKHRFNDTKHVICGCYVISQHAQPQPLVCLVTGGTYFLRVLLKIIFDYFEAVVTKGITNLGEFMAPRRHTSKTRVLHVRGANIDRGYAHDVTRAPGLTRVDHAVDELGARQHAVAVLVLLAEEVGDAELLGANPRHVALTPHLEVEVLEALQLRAKQTTITTYVTTTRLRWAVAACTQYNNRVNKSACADAAAKS